MITDIYRNPIMLTDFYNLNHFFLKENLDFEVSHIYNRSRPMILYGLNEKVRQILDVKITSDMVYEAEKYAKRMGLKSFPTEMWLNVVEKLNGYLPLKVQALKDGTWVPRGTPFAQISNTEEGFGELVTWFEAPLLHISFPSGCATRAFHIRKYLEEKNLPLHRVHSFGFRGHNSTENAYHAGTAWNLFLTGTDDFHTCLHTIPEQIGSIPATAHKTIQQFDNEYQAYLHSINETSKHGESLLSIVIDTYDPERFIKNYAVSIAKHGKEKGVKIIFRPDSGDVYEHSIRLYHLMNQYHLEKDTGIIIGEGMTFEKIHDYDSRFISDGVPLEYINFGIGAGFFKDIDRDHTGLAMKTGFSNKKNRMKFSATPIKRSIPGVVNIILDPNGKMMVEYSKIGLYNDIYHYDKTYEKPYTWVQTWADIQKIALSQNKKDLQVDIKYSKNIEQEINNFKEKYLKEEIKVGI